MSLNLTKKVFHHQFYHITHTLQLMTTCRNSIYHPKLISKFNKSPTSFYGSFLCGPTCFVTRQLLKKQGIESQVYKTNYLKFINGNYISDHCFIKLENGDILDPTWKQFLYDFREISIETNYSNYITSLPYFYLGSKQELLAIFKKCSDLYQLEFGRIVFNPYKVMQFYNQNPVDVSDRFEIEYLSKCYDKNQLKLIVESLAN